MMTEVAGLHIWPERNFWRSENYACGVTLPGVWKLTQVFVCVTWISYMFTRKWNSQSVILVHTLEAV